MIYIHRNRLFIFAICFLSVFWEGCSKDYEKNEKLKVVIFSASDHKEFEKFTYPIFFPDTINHVKCFVIKHFKNNDIVSPLPYKINNVSIANGEVCLYINSYSQMYPFFATDINLKINSNNYAVEMESHGDLINTAVQFDSLEKKNEIGVLFINSPISDTLNVLKGFFNIDYYKNNELTEKDFTVSIIFSVKIN